MDKINSKDIEIIQPKQVGRPKFEFTDEKLKQVYELASIMCTKQEVGTIIGCSHDTIERNEMAMENYKMGVANAKASIRRTQFKIATQLNSGQVAMWLGKVYLKQDRDDDEDESNNPLPLTDIV
jgi:hypothetical protein